MENRIYRPGIPSEILKLIACVCMLIDHAASVYYGQIKLYTLGGIIPFLRGTALSGVSLYLTLRGIGRIAFPIYCWMLAEGVHYTKNPRKYGLRLAIGAVLSELPFDYALHKGFDLGHQSVMITLLLGFLAAQVIRNTDRSWLKLLAAGAGYALGNLLHTDYRGNGVLLIILLCATQGQLWLQAVVMTLMCYLIGGMKVTLFDVSFPLELWGVLAIIPIALCSGRKLTRSKAVTIFFYLFYPGHLLILWIVSHWQELTEWMTGLFAR